MYLISAPSKTGPDGGQNVNNFLKFPKPDATILERIPESAINFVFNVSKISIFDFTSCFSFFQFFPLFSRALKKEKDYFIFLSKFVFFLKPKLKKYCCSCEEIGSSKEKTVQMFFLKTGLRHTLTTVSNGVVYCHVLFVF